MPEENVRLEVVIADYVQGLPLPPESVVVAIGSDGKPGKPYIWNRGEFRSFRVTNKRNKAAVARVAIPRLLIQDKSGISAYVDVIVHAWCEPNREELLAAAIAKYTRNPKRNTKDKSPRTIEDVVNDLVEDWLRTEIQGKEYLFLTSLLPGGDYATIANRIVNQAGTHLSLSISVTLELSEAAKLGTLPIEPLVLEVFPFGFARSKVPVTVRADLRPIQGRELIALASIRKQPLLKEIVRQEASRVLETSVSLDDLDARPPAEAKRKIVEAIDKRLLERGWQIANLDVVADLSKLPATPTAKINAAIDFQLKGLPREWSGTVSFLVYLQNRARYFESGIGSIATWAEGKAKTTATQALSSYDYEELLGVYRKKKKEIESTLQSLLEASGYVLNGFNLTTNLPLETLSGVIRTEEKQNVEFATRFPNCKVKLTYFVEYQIPDFTRVRNALLTNEDVPARVAVSVDQALRDQLRTTDLLDFYFHFEVGEKSAKSVRETLLAGIQRKLDADFGAQIRSSLLVREDDDVLRKIEEMVQPARQGDIEPFDILHPRLDKPVHIQTLVFLVREFSKEYFYQFVVTKPTIKQIEDSIKTHCEQWLVDVEPEMFFGIRNRELLRLFEDFVAELIQSEFGVTISIANFVLGRHSDVLPPGPRTRPVGDQLRFWTDLLPELQGRYREAILTDDKTQAASVKEQLEDARKEITRFEDELRRHEMDTRRQIAKSDPKKLMPGKSSKKDDLDDNDDEGAAAAGD